MNWHCHCSDVVREGGVVKIMPSGRVPAVVHLCMFRERGEEYRQRRLLYEPPAERDGSFLFAGLAQLRRLFGA